MRSVWRLSWLRIGLKRKVLIVVATPMISISTSARCALKLSVLRVQIVVSVIMARTLVRQ